MNKINQVVSNIYTNQCIETMFIIIRMGILSIIGVIELAMVKSSFNYYWVLLLIIGIQIVLFSYNIILNSKYKGLPSPVNLLLYWDKLNTYYEGDNTRVHDEFNKYLNGIQSSYVDNNNKINATKKTNIRYLIIAQTLFCIIYMFLI